MIKYRKELIDIETGEVTSGYLISKTYEKAFIKLTLWTIAKLLWDLGSKRHKIIAILLLNINERNNHIYFGRDDLIKFIKKMGIDISSKTIHDTLNMLIEEQFMKPVDEKEQEYIVNPKYIYFGSSEQYQNDQYNFDMNKFTKLAKRKQTPKSVSDVKAISTVTRIKNNPSYTCDFHFAKYKYEIMGTLLSKFRSKKVSILSEIFSKVGSGEEQFVIQTRGHSNLNKETVSDTLKYLVDKEIIFRIAPSTYTINTLFISRRKNK